MLTVILSSVEMTEKQKTEFEILYSKYKQLLFTVIRKIVNNDCDAEDILQNTFIKIAKNINKIEDINSRETKAFLIIVAKNTTYDFLRKQPEHKEISLDEIDSICADENEISTLVSNLQYEEIVTCVKDIPSPYMEVLYLHIVRDYSVKHTAKLLERKPQTVKMQLVRGKKILIKKLSEVLYD